MTSTEPSYAVLKPWGRNWWAAWHGRVARSQPVGLMGELARRGLPFQIAADEEPTAEEVQRLTCMPVNSGGFAEWQRHFHVQGIRLPKPERVRVAWMPSEQPPWTEAPVLMMALSVAERSKRYRQKLRLRGELADALVDAGRLGAWDAEDREAVETAVEQLLRDWIEAAATCGGADPLRRIRSAEESGED